jgi:hypothetical protein
MVAFLPRLNALKRDSLQAPSDEDRARPTVSGSWTIRVEGER